jgi:hypothetical protein
MYLESQATPFGEDEQLISPILKIIYGKLHGILIRPLMSVVPCLVYNEKRAWVSVDPSS